jgi:hypothetical protein
MIDDLNRDYINLEILNDTVKLEVFIPRKSFFKDDFYVLDFDKSEFDYG